MRLSVFQSPLFGAFFGKSILFVAYFVTLIHTHHPLPIFKEIYILKRKLQQVQGWKLITANENWSMLDKSAINVR